MSPDIGVILLTTCVLSVICVGLLGLILVAVGRVVGVSILERFSFLAGLLGLGYEPPPTVQLSPRERRRRPDFRNQADSLDFDAELARQRRSQTPPPPNTPRSDPPRPARPGQPIPPRATDRPRRLPDDDSPFGEHDGSSERRSTLRRRRRNRGENEDEIFGGILGDDDF